MAAGHQNGPVGAVDEDRRAVRGQVARRGGRGRRRGGAGAGRRGLRRRRATVTRPRRPSRRPSPPSRTTSTRRSPTRSKAGRRCGRPTCRCSPTRTPTAPPGTKVIPGLARALPKITDGGRTYTLFLRKGLRYSDGTPVRASDFGATIERMIAMNSPGDAVLHRHRRRRTVRRRRRHGGIAGIEADDKTGRIVIHLVEPRSTFSNELAMLFAAPLPADTKHEDLSGRPAAGHRPLRDRRLEAGQLLGIPAQPGVGEGQRQAAAADPRRALRRDRRERDQRTPRRR